MSTAVAQRLPLPRTSRRERHRAETRDRLFRAALRLFAERGYPDTTVEDITNAADVGKGTFFNYFPTKEHVLAAFGDGRIAAIERAVEQARKTKGPILPVIKNLAIDLAGQSSESPALLRSIYAAHASCAPVRAQMQKRVRDARKLLGEMFSLAQQRGEVRRDLSAADLGRLTQLVFHGVTVVWALSPDSGLLETTESVWDLISPLSTPLDREECTSPVEAGREKMIRGQSVESSDACIPSKRRKLRGGTSLIRLQLFLVLIAAFLVALGARPCRAQALPASGASSQATTSQSDGSGSNTSSAPAPGSQGGNFSGSVPTQLVPGVLPLSLQDAIDRGLKQNLGLLLSSSDIGNARGQRWQQLSALLPHISLAPYADVSQVNLAEFGFTFHSPGVNIPTIVGPFSYFDARANLSQTLFDWKAVSDTRAAQERVKSAEYTYKDARDLVVLAVGYAYLQGIADGALIESVDAQVKTAQALSDQASDQVTAGTSPAIDALRARVELQTRQQQLIQAKNDFAIQKLSLARTIGLAPGQQFELTDKSPYQPFEGITVDEAVKRAYANRSDFQASLADVRAAEYSRKAATAGHYPTVSFTADYGDAGQHFDSSHGVFDVRGTVNIPIFAGGMIHGDVLEADAQLQQSRDRLENVRAQIDADVRVAVLNLDSASQQVAVAQSNIDLAGQSLTQSRDRFAAGVTDTVEVVQAEEAVATAAQNYISSLYSYNYAKISLARAMGAAEAGVKEYFKENKMAQRTDVETPPSRPAENAAISETHSAAPPPPAHRQRVLRSQPYARTALIVAIIVLLVGGFFAHRYFSSYESTDDAEVDGHLMPLSARISGYLLKVNVDDNQYVQQGTILAEIDPRDYHVAVDRAQADVADAKATAQSLNIDIPITSVSTSSQVSASQADVEDAQAGISAAQQQADAAEAQLAQTQANDVKAQNDLARYKQLVDKQEVSQQIYDQALAAAKANTASVAAARASASAADQQIHQARAKLLQAQANFRSSQTGPQQVASSRARAQSAEANVQQKQSALEQAELNLQYTQIKAPVDGVVMKNAEVGMNVQPGQQLFTIVPLADVWVTANFKETQLKYMKQGQRAEVKLDANGRVYKGHVDSISGSSGARLSLLPPENATGNYVKVVQRVPVKIVLDQGQNDDHYLRLGMSVEPKVYVK